MRELPEDILIDRIIAGEQSLYNHLVEKHKDYAYTIAFNILNNEEDAEEVTHDSFVKAYQNLKKFNREAKFSTWLYRIVFNTAISRKRKVKMKKQDIYDTDLNLSESPKSELEIEDQKRFINKAMSAMSAADSTVLTLFYLKEFSLEEIAEITEDKLSTVKVRLHRARKRLAEELTNLLKNEALTL